MPLARYALYAEGVEVYVALHLGLGRHLAVEHAPHRGRGTVLGHQRRLLATHRRRPSRLPGSGAGLRRTAAGSTRATRWSSRPVVRWSPGRCTKSTDILLAEIDPERSAPEHRTLDVAGHYGAQRRLPADGRPHPAPARRLRGRLRGVGPPAAHRPLVCAGPGSTGRTDRSSRAPFCRSGRHCPLDLCRQAGLDSHHVSAALRQAVRLGCGESFVWTRR